MTMTMISTETLRTILRNSAYDYGDGLDTFSVWEQAMDKIEKIVENPLRPSVVCNITGGVLQGASANCPLDVYCLDFEEDEGGYDVEGSPCAIYQLGARVDPEFIDEVVEVASGE
jgi:hypothetical protein